MPVLWVRPACVCPVSTSMVLLRCASVQWCGWGGRGCGEGGMCVCCNRPQMSPARRKVRCCRVLLPPPRRGGVAARHTAMRRVFYETRRGHAEQAGVRRVWRGSACGGFRARCFQNAYRLLSSLKSRAVPSSDRVLACPCQYLARGIRHARAKRAARRRPVRENGVAVARACAPACVLSCAVV